MAIRALLRTVASDRRTNNRGNRTKVLLSDLAFHVGVITSSCGFLITVS